MHLLWSEKEKPTGRDTKEVPDRLTREILKERGIKWNGGRGTVVTVRDEKRFFFFFIINPLHLPV